MHILAAVLREWAAWITKLSIGIRGQGPGSIIKNPPCYQQGGFLFCMPPAILIFMGFKAPLRAEKRDFSAGANHWNH